MIEIRTQVSLKQYNTFAIDSKALYFIEVFSTQQLLKTLEFHKNNYPLLPILVLGGGSNILFTKDFEGLVIRLNIQGFELISESENDVILKIGAGEKWHEVVIKTLANSWFGFENLSLIPGTVGAAPIQNIGAYGVEIKDFILEVEGVNIEDSRILAFNNLDCAFGYRDSIFKNQLKDKFIITHVSFKLSKTPSIKSQYGAIGQELSKKGIINISPNDISDAVISIRQSKLPDPKITGNAGSFFKNPTISKSIFDELFIKYPHIPNYPNEKNEVKLAAGWLIESCGWKGKSLGNVACHKDQALVLINQTGKAKGSEILDLANQICSSVYEKFGILLEKEVNIR